jgi:hypothetical protein
MRLSDVFHSSGEIRFELEPKKAVEAILYLASRLDEPGLHNITHLLYFADKMHLETYGRFIFGDDYYAMEFGPVPSFCYSLLREATQTEEHGFKTIGRHVVPLRGADLDQFSESDIACLELAIWEHGNHPFPKIMADSHDAAYKAAWNSRGGKYSSLMSVESIAAQLKNGQELLSYLKNKHSK